LNPITEEHRKRLIELAEGWECAAKLTDEIVKAFQPDVDDFSASKVNDGKTYDIRLIRAVLDERATRDRYLKDAAAVRALLAAFDAQPKDINHGQ
jgi:hypothetical protein